MIVTGILLSILGVALLCWLLFAFAVQALPLFIGAIVGALLSQNGASATLAIAIELVAAASAFGITRFLYATTRSRLARAAIALVLTGPAAFAGYHASLGIARIAVSAGGWSEALALLGALVVGCAAFARLNAVTRRSADMCTSQPGAARQKANISRDGSAPTRRSHTSRPASTS